MMYFPPWRAGMNGDSCGRLVRKGAVCAVAGEGVTEAPTSNQGIAMRNDRVPRGVDGNDGVSAGEQSGDGSLGARAIGQHHHGGATAHPNPTQHSLAFVGDAVKRLKENQIAVGELIWNQLVGGGHIHVHCLDVKTGEQAEDFFMGALARMQQNHLGGR